MTRRNRAQMSDREQAARSRLAQLFHGQDLLAGSVVKMERSCGKAGCRCQRGEKHVSLYLSIRSGAGRKLIYVPRELEGWVQEQVGAYRQIQRLVQVVSQTCLGRLVEKKRAMKEARAQNKKRM